MSAPRATPDRPPARRVRGDPPSRERFATRRLTFTVDGDDCVGTLYRPRDVAEPATVVLGHGLAAEAVFGLDRVAEHLADVGYAAFTFDYRGFGASEGEPLVLPSRQIADWQAAVDRVRGVDALGDGIALWGVSLGGGHVVGVAAERYDVDAVVARTPFADGRSLLRSKSPRYLARAIGAGVRDRLAGLVGREHEVKVYGRPEEFAALNESGALDGYAALIPRDSTWQNETRARTLLALPRYRPVADASAVTCPSLVVAGTEDQVVPYKYTDRLADELPDSSLVALPMGHFDAWDDRFTEVLAHEVAFLDAVLERP
ncbi:alpha/beta fold hydrolase [Halobaculum sp. WSA2]|uniref:Alpha/beta fold hydrolase n=1 Tax=Halobaculum saliterrae TaxID=2073113 RepID=A0A6B0SUP7_9EURY|nr:alpha/beta fold hydrolase [Halobaculum saliterrae]MXR41356.1 alpha/beta fold hydrolase [Halobaculum saliterrae]